MNELEKFGVTIAGFESCASAFTPIKNPRKTGKTNLIANRNEIRMII